MVSNLPVYDRTRASRSIAEFPACYRLVAGPLWVSHELRDTMLAGIRQAGFIVLVTKTPPQAEII
jgi:hypothetical protein